MTEKELDAFMSKVLLDAIAFDEDRLEEKIPYAASARHRRQMRAMLKDPVRWARERGKPVWKRVLQTAAVILLMLSLGLGSVMLASPTARATIVRWVTEWYETHIVFRYAGEDAQGETSQYEPGELPEGFVENPERQFIGAGMTSHFYENEKGDVILFEYIYMQQPPWGNDISEDITDLSNYFVTSDGEDFLTILLHALEKAKDVNEDVNIESM